MAARKLKFKPKPVVGGAVRRPREKEDIPELSSQEKNIKQETSHDNIDTHSDIRRDQNSSGNKHDASEGNLSKRIRTEQAENTMLVPPIEVDKTCDLTCSSASELVKGSEDETTKNITSNKTTEQGTDLNVVKTICLESSLTQSRESSKSTLVSPLCSQESTGDESRSETNLCLNTETNSMTSSNISHETIVNLNSTDKAEVTKGLPRFGRSKFKPVLNNNVSRKKVEINYNSINNESAKPNVYPVAIIQTESVIKCVKSESNKCNLVSEITESFSALESDESDPLLVNPPQAKENELSKKTCRFDNGNEDKTTKNESGTNRVYLVNTKKSMQTTINVTESSRCELGTSNSESCNTADQIDSNHLHQILDNINNSEISNSNVQTSSAPKVPIGLSPLKLASKILVPKPCPNLLDTTVRRISFHGSDSEEESKRKISLHNDKLGKKIKKEKETKNNKRKLSQGSTYSKLGQEALEKFTQKFGKVGKLEPTDKSKLTMLDLIFYNPKSNPMSASSEQTGIRKKEDKCEVSGMVTEALDEQKVDDVEEVEAPVSAPAVPVPQLKVGPDGQIMLDPNSLVIETTEVKEKRAEMEKSEVIRETGITRYNTYSKKKHTRKDWSAQETLQFYKALNTIGSDFTLMTKLFPKRSRHELKLKFKKEEKTNMKLVDLAMTAPTDFDFSSLEEEMKQENEELARLEEEKRFAAEAAKKARAQRKEDKEKNKGNRSDYHRSMRIKDAAFKDFDECEIEKMKRYHNQKKPKSKKKRVVKKKQPVMLIASSSDEEEVPISIDLDSDEADLEESEMKLLKMIRDKTRAGSRKGRRIKQAKKLEEYEEINETLKRKLEEIDSDLSDGYTPNGPGADMLFGSPARDPFPDNPSQEGDGSQWSMEVTSVPSAEDTVFMNNVEDVRELSELGSLGQKAIALNLSLPLGTSAPKQVAQGSEQTDSVLNRRLISESIQIIDQLTSNEHLNENPKNITSDKPIEDKDPSKSPANQELSENHVPLPSFESVSRSRPPVVYSLQEDYVPALSDEDNAKLSKTNNPSIIPAESDQQPDKHEKDSNQQGVVLSYYCNEAEECILGD